MKTNRLDSLGLAENLRGGQLKSIHVPTTLYRELRHLTQLRDALVSEVVAMKQRIKSLLLMEGLEFPPAPPGSQWSFLVKAKLRKLPCSSVVRFKLDQLLDNLEFGEKQVLKVTREIRRFCQNDPELSQCIDYLKSLPGIGWIVASQMLARIGTGARSKTFVSCRPFWDWCPPRAPPEREPLAARLLTAEIQDCAANSFKLLGRRSARMASC